jgi:hypothetical protein
MSDFSQIGNEKSRPQSFNELLQINLPLIQQEISKLRNDAKHSISKTIDISPAQVNIVKVSEEKIVIELNVSAFDAWDAICPSANLDHLFFLSQLKQPQEQTDSGNEEAVFDDSNEAADRPVDGSSSKSDAPNHAESSGKSDNEEAFKESESGRSDLNESKNSAFSRRVCRSLSESDGSSASKLPKGILKYPKEWKKRTLSECSFEGSHLPSDYDTDKDASTGDLAETEGAGKPLKKVTFNQKVFKSVFKKNSTITVKRPRKEQKAKESRKTRPDSIDLKVTTDVEENDLNVVNSQPTLSSSASSAQTAALKVESDVTKEEQPELDSANLTETADTDDWAEVRSKKSRSRRKRTDSRSSSDHSECEDNAILDKPMSSLLKVLHSSPPIQVK